MSKDHYIQIETRCNKCSRLSIPCFRCWKEQKSIDLEQLIKFRKKAAFDLARRAVLDKAAKGAS